MSRVVAVVVFAVGGALVATVATVAALLSGAVRSFAATMSLSSLSLPSFGTRWPGRLAVSRPEVASAAPCPCCFVGQPLVAALLISVLGF